MAKATEDQLNKLHGMVATVLTMQLADPEECTAATVAIAAKFLKDNDITASIEDNKDMTSLSDALKEKREKRKLRVVE